MKIKGFTGECSNIFLKLVFTVLPKCLGICLVGFSQMFADHASFFIIAHHVCDRKKNKSNLHL